jgi:hypothetical protein
MCCPTYKEHHEYQRRVDRCWDGYADSVAVVVARRLIRKPSTWAEIQLCYVSGRMRIGENGMILGLRPVAMGQLGPEFEVNVVQEVFMDGSVNLLAPTNSEKAAAIAAYYAASQTVVTNTTPYWDPYQ